MSYFLIFPLVSVDSTNVPGLKYRQRDVKEAILAASSAGEHIDPSIDEIAPFAIPIIHPSLSKFIYVSQNVIMKVRFLLYSISIFQMSSN